MDFNEIAKLKTKELKEKLNNMSSKEIVHLLVTCVENFPVDAKKWADKDNRKASRRIRSRSVLFGKIAKVFRAKSIAEIKQDEFVH